MLKAKGFGTTQEFFELPAVIAGYQATEHNGCPLKGYTFINITFLNNIPDKIFKSTDHYFRLCISINKMQSCFVLVLRRLEY